MKKIFLCTILMLVWMFTSCRHETDGLWNNEDKSFSLVVEVDRMGSGLQTEVTRAIVEAENGEDDVTDLYLLFFEQQLAGNALCKGYHKIEGAVTIGQNIPVKYDVTGVNSGNFSILALANVDDYFFDSERLENVTDFLNVLYGRTKTEVVREAMAYVRAGISETDNYTDKSIRSGALLMSGSVDKAEGESEVKLKLTRAVSRFDVTVQRGIGYTLESVSIWNNIETTPLWLASSNVDNSVTINGGRFYGVNGTNETNAIKGELYAFENFLANPAPGDQKTTCLILGIKKESEATTYYRVNIHPEKSGQSLKRNYVYQLTVRDVAAAGATTEQAAYEQTTAPDITIDINNWMLDDEGMILTDGKNTLAIPSKIVRFYQEGGVHTYNIFTQGEGTLSIANTNLPAGLSAGLSDNLFTVNAVDLGGLTSREGTVELTFAGLRATVQVIQVNKEVHFLKLDKSSLNVFPASGGKTAADGQQLVVSSSASWKATIYNTGSSCFSFELSSLATEKTGGVTGEDVTLYVSEDNSINRAATGFILFKLEDHPGYAKVLMLKQNASGGISIDSGTLTNLDFRVDGTPKQVQGATAGTPIEIKVLTEPGSGETWNCSFDGDYADKFAFHVELNNETGEHRVSITPNSGPQSYPYFNTTANVLNNTYLEVYLGDVPETSEPKKYKRIDVSQDALLFEVEESVRLSTKGGTLISPVTLSEGLTWSATVKTNTRFEEVSKYAEMSHKGYILDGTQKITEIGEGVSRKNGSVSLGYDKLYFPIVNIAPEATIEIVIDQIKTLPEAKKELALKQDMLVPRQVNILDVDCGGASYGSFESGYGENNRTFMMSTELFGPNKSSRCYAEYTKPLPENVNSYDATKEPIYPIPSTYNYVHAGYQKDDLLKTGFDAMNNWRKENDGVLYFMQDEREGQFFSWLKDAIGYEVVGDDEDGNYTYTTISMEAGTTRIHRYLYEDGPFGAVIISDIEELDMNNLHSAIYRSSLGTAIPIMVKNDFSDHIICFIDPDKNIVYLGEAGAIDDGGFSLRNMNSTNGKNKARSLFLANFVSYVIRAAQYGSHFTDHFNTNRTTVYPFDKLGTQYPEPVF